MIEKFIELLDVIKNPQDLPLGVSEYRMLRPYFEKISGTLTASVSILGTKRYINSHASKDLLPILYKEIRSKRGKFSYYGKINEFYEFTYFTFEIDTWRPFLRPNQLQGELLLITLSVSVQRMKTVCRKIKIEKLL